MQCPRAKVLPDLLQNRHLYPGKFDKHPPGNGCQQAMESVQEVQRLQGRRLLRMRLSCAAAVACAAGQGIEAMAAVLLVQRAAERGAGRLGRCGRGPASTWRLHLLLAMPLPQGGASSAVL